MQPVFFKLDWHFDERFIGFLLALNGLLIALFEMVLINYLDRKKHTLIYISIGVLMGGIGFALLNLLPHYSIAAILIVVLVTFAEMFSMPFMNSFWVRRSSDNNRGEYAALYSMAWSTAQIVAPFVGGYIISFGGFALLYWVLASVSLITFIGYLSLYWFNYHLKSTLNS